MKKIILLATSISRTAEVDRLINSLARQSILNLGCTIHLLFLNQKSNVKLEKMHFNSNLILHELKSSEVLPLSVARNILLRELHQLNPRSDDLVGFPDDDCWYSPDFFERIISGKMHSVIICNVFDPILNLPYGRRPKVNLPEISQFQALNFGISVGIYFSYGSLNHLFFDENFGLGAKYPAGEETIFLSNLIAGQRVQYLGGISVFHESDKNSLNSEFFSRIHMYTKGYVVACREISKHNQLLGYGLILRQFLIAIIMFLVTIWSPRRKKYYYRLLGIYDGMLLKRFD